MSAEGFMREALELAAQAAAAGEVPVGAVVVKTWTLDRSGSLTLVGGFTTTFFGTWASAGAADMPAASAMPSATAVCLNLMANSLVC